MRVSRPDHPTSCGLFVPLSVAGALMMFVATAVNLYPVWLERQGIRGGGTGLNAQIPAVDGAARTEEYVPLTGLIDPHCGDQCTDPAQTKTVECAGQFDLPILGGMDVVEYWNLAAGAEPVSGKSSLTALWRNYRFFFSSVGNLRKFEADKLKYLPAWGGFCSYGVANEPVWTNTTMGPFGNPTLWKILDDGRLHIFRSPVPMHAFDDDIRGNIERGDAAWRDWFGEDSWGPLNTACFCTKDSCLDQ